MTELISVPSGQGAVIDWLGAGDRPGSKSSCFVRYQVLVRTRHYQHPPSFVVYAVALLLLSTSGV